MNLTIEGTPCWHNTRIKCLFCQSTHMLYEGDRPIYADRKGVSIGIGEYWELEWECPRCGQTMVKKFFLKY